MKWKTEIHPREEAHLRKEVKTTAKRKRKKMMMMEFLLESALEESIA
jgi:hypothetical protein